MNAMIATLALTVMIALIVMMTPPVLVFITETLLGVRALLNRPAVARAASSPAFGRAVVLIPAHNEAQGLPAVLDALSASVGDRVDIMVVADNCTDGTAEIARRHGATVVERQDDAQRGKGYALAAGRDALLTRSIGEQPDCVVILDADCTPEPGAIGGLADCAIRSGRPVQGRYLMRARDNALFGPQSAAVSVSNFAFWLKNDVRQRGAAALGGAAILTGSGMAVPWSLMASAQLASGNIVEDLALGIAFVGQGAAPIYQPEATIWSEPASVKATSDQRLRWERGFLATARTEGLPLISAGLRQGRFAPFWLGMHLMTPPTVLLLILAIAAMLLSWMMFFLEGGAIPAIAGLAVTWLALLPVMLLIAIGAAWAAGGSRWLPKDHVLALPSYLLLKILVYMRLLRGQGKEWTRTGRSKEAGGSGND